MLAAPGKAKSGIIVSPRDASLFWGRHVDGVRDAEASSALSVL
jgi:hypothetical protein